MDFRSSYLALTAACGHDCLGQDFKNPQCLLSTKVNKWRLTTVRAIWHNAGVNLQWASITCGGALPILLVISMENDKSSLGRVGHFAFN